MGPESVARFRSGTPGVGECLFLDSAGASLMPEPVIDAVRKFLDLETKVGGYEAERLESERIEGFNRSVAGLVNCKADNIAFAESATIAYASVLSCLGLGDDSVIITSEDDYISNQLMFLSLAGRLGVTVRRAESLPQGGVDPESVEELLRSDPRAIVAITHVPTNSGLVQDVEAVGEVCSRYDAVYIVDACQSVGQLAVDTGRIGCDYLTASTRKFLRGPRGTGFLFASDRALASGRYPLFVDMRGAEWTGADTFRVQATAKRFETWESPYALLVGASTAVQYAIDAGIEDIEERNTQLAASLREGLESAGARVLDRGRRRCAIVTATLDGRERARVEKHLREQGVLFSVSLREYAQIDFPRKNAEWGLRLSPHYFNTENEIDRVVDIIASIPRS